MRTALPKPTSPTRSHRPRAVTVFAAAFVAGAAAAVGVNRALDVRMAQSKPRVESEAIFVALRSLPQGAPVTVWDVGLRDWPKAMLPATALRASDTFSGHVLKHPLREGQPLLSIQLVPAGQSSQPAGEPTAFPPPAAYTQISAPAATPDGDLWAPAEPVQTPADAPVARSESQPAQTAVPTIPPIAAPPAEPTAAQPVAAQPVAEPPVATDPMPVTVEPEAVAVTETPVAEPNVAAPPSQTAEAASAPLPEPQPEAIGQQAAVPESVGPETTASSGDAPAPATAASVGDAPDPVVSPTVQPATPPAVSEAVATTPPPAPPVERPRPAHARYLVVPERIAVQADTSFAAPAPAPQHHAVTATPATTANAPRPGSSDVRPLPPTATADRGALPRPQAGPHGKPPQRQGRQPQPARSATPSVTPPQPRLGAAIFPTLSAGIDAVEGRFRRDQPTQPQSPHAESSRPVTAR